MRKILKLLTTTMVLTPKTLLIGMNLYLSSNTDKHLLLLFNRNYSGLVEECVAEKITVPLKNPYVKRKLDIARFEKIKTFGQDVTVTFHDWEWRGGNNSKVIKKEW